MSLEDIGSAVDPLNMNLSNVDTSMPVLVPGPYVLSVSKMEVKNSKTPGKESNKNLNIELVLTEPAQTTSGKTVSNFKLYHTISLTSSEKYDPAQKLAQFKEAVLGTKEGSFAPFEQYYGQRVSVQLVVESSVQYGDQNRIKSFIKRG
jgi:hypothetical protein